MVIRLFFLLFFSVSLLLTAQDLTQQGNTVRTGIVDPNGAKSPLTIREQLKLAVPSDILISPDGEKAAYTIRQPDIKGNRWVSQLGILDVRRRTYRIWTTAPDGTTMAAWSPNGEAVTFVSERPYLDGSLNERSGSRQLFTISIHGGEAEALTHLPNGVDEYAWFPDGNNIALLTEGDPPKPEDATTTTDDAVSSSNPKAPKEIWILRMSDRHARRIAVVDRGVTGMDVAPDGAAIYYQTNYTGEYNDEQNYDIWSITVDGLQQQVTSTSGPETKPRVSPDGEAIAFITQTVPDIEFAQTDLCIMDARGSNRRNLTAEFDHSVTDFRWDPSGRSILFLVDRGLYSELFRCDLKSGSLRRVTNADAVYSSLSVAAKKGTICLGHETGTSLREILAIDGKREEILTDFSRQLDHYRVGRVDSVAWLSRDGKFGIEGLLATPPDYDPAKQYPFILFLHGGPYGHYRLSLVQGYPVHHYLSQGYVCLLPNVRGSSGYSDAFGQANRYDLGGGDYEDAMAGVDYLIERGIIDSTRMGVTGGSYGGYLTNWVISQTTRFKAAVSLYGIFSWFTDWSNSWQPAFEQMYFGYNYWERPMDMSNLFISRAPQTYVKNITTPVLILQGTDDPYTNIANSREMFQALKELDRTVEFVTYKGEGHGLRKKPNNYIDSMERASEWFRRYLLQAR